MSRADSRERKREKPTQDAADDGSSLVIFSMAEADALLDPRGHCCSRLSHFCASFITSCCWVGFYGSATQLYFKAEKRMLWVRKIDGSLMHFVPLL